MSFLSWGSRGKTKRNLWAKISTNILEQGKTSTCQVYFVPCCHSQHCQHLIFALTFESSFFLRNTHCFYRILSVTHYNFYEYVMLFTSHWWQVFTSGYALSEYFCHQWLVNNIRIRKNCNVWRFYYICNNSYEIDEFRLLGKKFWKHRQVIPHLKAYWKHCLTM